jgi:2,3-bisphosphoglycerate-dependent phosphoglycerate mutase
MLELILVRHGVTAWNLQKRFQGQLDTPLSEAGHEQAALTADALAGEPVSSVYASDLLRAQQTAYPIAENLGLPLLAEISLRERHFGQFQGKTHSELASDFPDDFAKWQARDLSFDFGGDGGETLPRFYKRVEMALATIIKRSIAQTAGPLSSVLIVTHGGVLNMAHHLATQTPLEQPRDHPIENCSINRVGWDGRRFHLISWGNVDHLQS